MPDQSDSAKAHHEAVLRSLEAVSSMPLLSDASTRLYDASVDSAARQAADVFRKLAGRLVEGRLAPDEVGPAVDGIVTALWEPKTEATGDTLARTAVNLTRALYYRMIPADRNAAVVAVLIPEIIGETSTLDDKWQGDLKEHLAMSVNRGILTGTTAHEAATAVLANLDEHWQRASTVSDAYTPQQLAVDALFSSTWKPNADPVFRLELLERALAMITVEKHRSNPTTRGLMAKGLAYSLHLGIVPMDMRVRVVDALIAALPDLRGTSLQYGFIATAVEKVYGTADGVNVSAELAKSLREDDHRGLYAVLPEAFENAIQVARLQEIDGAG